MRRRMPSNKSTLSRADFDRILTRALELEANGDDVITEARAQEIAIELGISPDAWITALAEYRRDPVPDQPPPSGRTWRRWTLLALSGFSVGAVWSTLRRTLEIPGAYDRPMSVALLGIGLAIGLWQLNHRGLRDSVRDLTAWWGSLPFGFAIGFGGDALWFALTAWSVCAVVAAGFGRWLRSRRILRRFAAQAR
jgi:hypothetical protein